MIDNEPLTSSLHRLNLKREYAVYTELENELKKITPQDSNLPVLKVAIVRNFTIEPLVPVLNGEIALAGFYPQIFLGNFDAIQQEILDPESEIYRFKPDFIIVAQWLDALAPQFTQRFLSFSKQQIDAEIERLVSQAENISEHLRRHTDAPILFNNFPLPAIPTLGILDAQSSSYQVQTLIDLNRKLLERLCVRRDVYLVDLMSLVSRIGSRQAIDERYWHIGRAPIGRHMLVPLGREYGRFFHALSGKTRKCLVLDCDNTLWGGVVGEDGLEGIKLGHTYPGSGYLALQAEILNLHDRGVILAMCSKNNEADVMEVLENHPDMLLKKENFATWQINWNDKVSNIQAIAQELNIGLDSLVFVDDSEFECNLVRERLPQVSVLCLSGEVSTYKTLLGAEGFFDSLTYSAEDRDRNQMYRAENERQHIKESAGSLEDYLEQLEIQVEIGEADDFTIPRISQLTQKTNQFNLTTRRYSEGQIRSLAENPEADVFYVKLKDRISDMGIIGVAIVTYRERAAEIDSFMLSCRALGRGVEDTMVAYILEMARRRNCNEIYGCYLATKKNGQTSGFYQRLGFELMEETPESSLLKMSLDRIFQAPKWIEIVSSEK